MKYYSISACSISVMEYYSISASERSYLPREANGTLPCWSQFSAQPICSVMALHIYQDAMKWATPDHLSLDSGPNLGPLKIRWEL